jgi:hypothetical protein
MALLLSTNIAFAQNTVTIPSGTLERCTANHVPVILDNMATDIGAIGIPLAVVGDATITAATPIDLAGFGYVTGVGGFPGTAGVLNAYHPAGCGFPPGGSWILWDLEVTTGVSCSGTVDIIQQFYPPAGAFLIIDCMGVPDPAPVFVPGSFTITTTPPSCGTNPDHSINFMESISQQLDATPGNPCATLEFALVDGDGLTNPDITIGGLFTYDGDCLDIGTHTVEFSVTDDCSNVISCFFDVEVTNTAPICDPPVANETVYWQDEIIGKQLTATDPDGVINPLTFSNPVAAPPFIAAAMALTTDGVFDLTGVDCVDVGTRTITFDVSDGCYTTQCTFDITVYQNPPVCTNPLDETINWLEPLDVTLNATDDGCQGTLTWTILSETPAPTTGGHIAGNHYIFMPDCLDVGLTFTVVVQVSDGLATDQCQFDVEVINPAPTITCPPDMPVVVLGDLVSTAATATDPYNDPLVFSLVSFTKISGGGGATPHNMPIVNTDGTITWQTESFDTNDEGLWELCVMVDDLCGGTDMCCFTMDVLSFTLCMGPIGPISETMIDVLNGQTVSAYVKIRNGYPLGGLDLLICYDPTGLTFLDAEPVGNLAAWEWFTYRHYYQDNCGGGCPTGYLRVLAMADLDNGPDVHPDDAEFYLHDEIVKLNFYVTADRNFIGQCLPVSFCTMDCGDNTLSSKSGDTLFVPIGSDISCIDSQKEVARDIIYLCGAIICIREPIDDRGDINLNGIANEVGDAVLLTNFFIYGESVWDPVWKDSQLLASDVNDDGVVATVADLVYLIRIITGDANPYPANPPKLSPYASTGSVSYRVENGAMTVSTNSSVDLGGAAFVFRYSGVAVGTPSLSDAASDMRIRSAAAGGEFRVLVSPDYEMMTRVQAGNNDLFTVPVEGDGRIELVESQLSDGNGALMSTVASAVRVPQSYALHQNYPNPFNAGTVIPFDLKKAGDWTLNVYNVAGQLVKSFSGHDAPGQVNVTWNGTDNSGSSTASGVYFYRVSSGDFTATKKMTLLK